MIGGVQANGAPHAAFVTPAPSPGEGVQANDVDVPHALMTAATTISTAFMAIGMTFSAIVSPLLVNTTSEYF